MAAIITPVGRIADIIPGNRRFFTRPELFELVGTDNPTVIPATVRGRRMAFVYNSGSGKANDTATELLGTVKGSGTLNGMVLVCNRSEIF